MKFFKNLKKNNKGFSLVELIIVIAIMAVLVGTLAPQYIRYVEKSRMAADATTIENFVSVCEVMIATPNNGLSSTEAAKADSPYTIKCDNNGNMVVSDTLKKVSLFTELVDTSRTYTMKSSAYKTSKPSITIKYADSKWTVALTGYNSAE